MWTRTLQFSLTWTDHSRPVTLPFKKLSRQSKTELFDKSAEASYFAPYSVLVLTIILVLVLILVLQWTIIFLLVHKNNIVEK